MYTEVLGRADSFLADCRRRRQDRHQDDQREAGDDVLDRDGPGLLAGGLSAAQVQGIQPCADRAPTAAVMTARSSRVARVASE